MEQTIKTELENAAKQGSGALRRFAKRISGTAEDLAERVTSSADSALDSLGERIGDVSESISERASGKGVIQRVGRAVSGGMQDVGNYLVRQDLRGMFMDLGGVMKRNPGKTILIGAGMGYLLARWLRK